MGCPNLNHVDAFVDGELEPTPLVEMERHVGVCESCRREVMATRALKTGLAVHAGAVRAPEALRAEVQRKLGHGIGTAAWKERAYEGVLLAAAAAMLLVFGAGVWPAREPGHVVETGTPVSGASVASVPVSAQPVALLPDVIERHADPLPTEAGTERAEDLPNWFRDKLGFRVGSVRFQAPEVHFLGARVSQVGRERAAKLYYRVGQSRVTVLAFAASPSVRRALAQELEASRHAALAGHDVAYHNVRGYTVPVFEHQGVIYAVTGDVDQEKLLALLASARLD